MKLFALLHNLEFCSLLSYIYVYCYVECVASDKNHSEKKVTVKIQIKFFVLCITM